MAGMTPDQIASKLLNFGAAQYDVGLLDKVVGSLETGTPEERRWSHELLVKMQDHPQAWSKVDVILESSKSDATKFMAIHFLQRVVRFKWKMVPEQQQKSIRSYLIQLIVRLSGNDRLLQQHSMLLSKLNVCLVQLLKQDWPHKWPSFISDLVKSSRASESVCQNNMEILRLLNEEVFDFSSGQLTQDKVRQLKAQLKEEFSLVFRLCDFVLKNSKRVAVVQATLKTLNAFLGWIPPQFFFETSLIPLIMEKFLTPQPFRSLTLQCLTEIAQLTFEGGQYNAEFAKMLSMMVEKLSGFVPPDTDFEKAVSKGNREDEVFVGHLSLFFTTFLSKHLAVVESAELRPVDLRSHAYLVSLSMVGNLVVFKLCVEYWNKLSSDLYMEAASVQSGVGSRTDVKARQQFYEEILAKVRVILISRMAKPEEVLIVTDELGNAERVRVHQDTDQIQLYKLMRETLIFLTHLNYDDTENIMLVRLAGQVDGSEWSHHNLNTLCWAIGSISGAHSEGKEKRFLVTVIKELLGMCERKRGKDNKAVIASNIMYIVGQYPRFLRAHWTFLKTVVKKLFEFMHEHHPGVRDMACDTFLQITIRCKRKFVTLQSQENVPFVVEILENMGEITHDLESGQVCVFFEALGVMISSCTEIAKREKYIQSLMRIPNQRWGEIMHAAASNVQSLYSAEQPSVQLAEILRLNTRACSRLGQSFIPQLKHIYLDMLNVYKVYARAVSEALSGGDPMARNRPIFRHMRTVKRQVLELMETFVSNSGDPTMFFNNFVRLPDGSSPLLSAVLVYFKKGHKDGREASVLSLMTAIINKLKSLMAKEVGNILDHVFEPTLEIITSSREAAPDMRLQYYRLLRAINEHMFMVFAQLPSGSFKVVMDGLVWGFKNPKREIAEAALLLLIELMTNVSHTAEMASSFYRMYFLKLLRQMFIVITDPFFISGFDHQARALWQMIHLVEEGKIRVPLWEQGSQPGDMNVQRFVRIFVRDMLVKAFPNILPATIEEFVRRLFDINLDMSAFRGLLRDFLVQMKEWSNVDRGALMGEERKAMQEQRHREELRRAAHIPGLIPVKDREELAQSMQ